jgi:hypothetical protein
VPGDARSFKASLLRRRSEIIPPVTSPIETLENGREVVEPTEASDF